MTNEFKDYPRLFNLAGVRNESIFLFGPRGTGKTSWIKANLPNALYLDLLASDTYKDLVANPARLENMIPPDFQNWVVIDEVQKIPELLNEVHRLIEAKKLQFLLTGSSARSLKRKGVNLLAGRALNFRMHPLTCLEMQADFSLEKALKYGMLPQVYMSDLIERYLDTYITTYLREEVLQEGIARNITEFARFLEIASFSQGEVLNYSEVAREAAIPAKIVSDYFGVLEDLLIGFRLPVFSKRSKRKLISHQKFYYFDTGVYRAIRPKGPLDTSDEIDGPALETLFLQHLKAFNDYFDLKYQLYFWRTSSQLEIDFIAYGEKGLLAFEVKRKQKISTKDLTALNAFAEDYPMAKLYLLYGGQREEYYGNIHVIPFEKALLQLPEILRNN